MASRNADCITVLTNRSDAQILREGGIKWFTINKSRSEKYKYVVAVQTRRQGGEPSHPHGIAFIVGKVAGVAATSVGNKRMIQISEYAEVSRPVSWGKSRNPVLYRNLAELGFDIASLQWKPVPAHVVPDEALDESAPARETDESGVLPLTIAQAKQGLAAYFQVSPDQVEITVTF